MQKARGECGIKGDTPTRSTAKAGEAGARGLMAMANRGKTECEYTQYGTHTNRKPVATRGAIEKREKGGEPEDKGGGKRIILDNGSLGKGGGGCTTCDCLKLASEGGSLGGVAAAGMPLEGTCVAVTSSTVGCICAMGIRLGGTPKGGGGTAVMEGATTLDVKATTPSPLLPVTVRAAWQMCHLR